MDQVQVVTDGRAEAAIREAVEAVGTLPIPVRILDQALDEILERTLDGVPTLAIVAPDEAEAAHAALGTALDEVVVWPAHPGELTARLRQLGAPPSDVQARSRAPRLLAHDVNNPLTAIRLLAEMMTMDVQDEESAEDVRDILEASDLAGALVESLSALAKLESAPPGKGAGMVDLSAILSEAARRPALSSQVVVGEAPRGVTVRGDAGRLKQAIVDLLLNGRRMAEGTGTPVRATVRVEGETATVEVRVDGVSLPERLHDSLRQPWRAWVARDARIQVAPTGLAVADRVARLSGGRLELGTEATRAVVRLVLPLARRG